MEQAAEDPSEREVLQLLLREASGEANSSSQAAQKAIARLWQATLYVALWTAGQLRTLTNSSGDHALPAFTDLDALREAAARLGWYSPEGEVSHRALSGAELFRAISELALDFLIVDLNAAHAFEISRRDLEEADARFRQLDAQALIARQSLSPLPESAAEVQFMRVPHPLPEDLIQAVSDVLRTYLEVEWAVLAKVARLGAAPRLTIGLKLHAEYRARLEELVGAIRIAAHAAIEEKVDVLVLDDPLLIRRAREDATLFFPWRRRDTL